MRPRHEPNATTVLPMVELQIDTWRVAGGSLPVYARSAVPYVTVSRLTATAVRREGEAKRYQWTKGEERRLVPTPRRGRGRILAGGIGSVAINEPATAHHAPGPPQRRPGRPARALGAVAALRPSICSPPPPTSISHGRSMLSAGRTAPPARRRASPLGRFGASHPDNEVSCDVRHGEQYEQRCEEAKVDVQQLRSLVDDRVAKLVGLGGDGGLSTDPSPPDPGSLAFWGYGIGGDEGRGIGGDEEVTLPGSRLNADLDLSGLTQIQVWIGYRFLR